MQRVRIRKDVPIRQLNFPTPIKTLDAQGRVVSMVYNYPSIRVSYDITWIGVTNTLATYTQTIIDQA